MYIPCFDLRVVPGPCGHFCRGFINFSACLPLAFLIEAIAEVRINTIPSAVVHIHEELPLVDAVGAIRDGVDGWLYLRRWAQLLTFFLPICSSEMNCPPVIPLESQNNGNYMTICIIYRMYEMGHEQNDLKSSTMIKKPCFQYLFLTEWSASVLLDSTAFHGHGDVINCLYNTWWFRQTPYRCSHARCGQPLPSHQLYLPHPNSDH